MKCKLKDEDDDGYIIIYLKNKMEIKIRFKDCSKILAYNLDPNYYIKGFFISTEKTISFYRQPNLNHISQFIKIALLTAIRKERK